MTDLLCERCARPGNVRLSSIPPNRSGVVEPAAEHRYCRDCARAVGVPIPERGTPTPNDDAAIDWAGLQEFYAMLARIPLTDSAQRAEVASQAAETLRMLDRLPEKAPPELRALLERISGRTV